MQFLLEVCSGKGQLMVSWNSTNEKKEKSVLASRMGIWATARDGHVGDSNDADIFCGSKNNENAICNGLHESERLGGHPMEPAWFNADGDCRQTS